MDSRCVLLIGVGLLFGCGQRSDLPRATVSGKVAFQGKPVPEGMIAFVPIKETKGPTSSAIIKEGVYEAAAAGGVPIGAHRVEIQAFRPRTGARRTHQSPFLQDREPREQYLPERYNRQSTLEITIDAESGGNHDFDLK